MLSGRLRGLRCFTQTLGTALSLLLVMQQACLANTLPAAEAPSPPSMTAADVGAFFDGYLPAQMERADIAGAVVAVVKEGRVLYSNGYGYADRADRTPVSAATTLFRIGSISKLFTWTAVMQLAEQGRIDLDVDIQRYLDIPIRPAFGAPITMRELMTHTAGFEETVEDILAAPGDSLSLHDYLAHHQPRRIFAPGSTPAYSNYGAALAGYIVERVSGEHYDDYVARHILEPLGMHHTSFAQPLPADLAPRLSAAYDEDEPTAKPFEWIRIAPAGSGSSSALDMSAFMLAQLGYDSGGHRILQPSTRKQMQAPQRRQGVGTPALTLGFWEDGSAGLRVIAHAGDSAWFHSGLYLMPDQQVGLFYVQNSSGDYGLRDRLFRTFVHRYFPQGGETPAPPATSGSESVDGWYLSSRRNESSPLYLGALLSEQHVTQEADGSLRVGRRNGIDGKPLRFVPAGADTWQDAGLSGRKVFFRRNAAGTLEMSGTVGVEVEQRVSWYQSAVLIECLLVVGLTIPLLSLLGRLASAAVHQGNRDSHRNGSLQRLRLGSLPAAALALLLPWIVGLALPLLGLGQAGFAPIGPGFSQFLRAMQVACWLAVAGMVLAMRLAWKSWRNPTTVGERCHASLMACAGLSVAAVAARGGFLFWTGGY